VILLMLACTFVTPAERQAALDARDEDQDGYPRGGDGELDCDDEDPDIHPGADDAWYDGIDSNCDGANDWDQDGDGAVEASYPGDDADIDCDDTDPARFPGNEDAWYDGVDSDCAGNSDFDQDGDTVDREPEGGDCDDEDDTIRPGADDAWYDGIDSNCDEADDFDQDGDGFQRVPEGEDCNDLIAAIKPGVDEVWYDGTDQNCDESSDYDQDGDGFEREPEGADCDDTDIEAYPGTLEDLSDATRDLDCDDQSLSFAADDLGWSVTNPHDVRALHDGTEAWVVFGGDLISDGTNSYAQSVMGLRYDDSPEFGHTGQKVLHAGTASITLGDGLALHASGGDLYVGLNRLTSTQRIFTLVRLVGADSTTDTVVSPQATTTALSDLALVLDDDGAVHLVGCEAASVQTLKASDADLAIGAATGSSLFTSMGGTACAVSVLGANSASLLLTEPTETVAYNFDPSESVPTYSAPVGLVDAFDAIRLDEGPVSPVLLTLDAVNGQIDLYNQDTEQQVISAPGAQTVQMAHDVALGRLYVIWTDDTGAVGLAWGDDDLLSSFTVGAVTVPFSATGAAVVASGDGARVLVAVTGANDLATGVAIAP
jgi:hypothetical protein